MAKSSHKKDGHKYSMTINVEKSIMLSTTTAKRFPQRPALCVEIPSPQLAQTGKFIAQRSAGVGKMVYGSMGNVGCVGRNLFMYLDTMMACCSVGSAGLLWMELGLA